MAHQKSLLHFFAKRPKLSEQDNNTKETTTPTATGTVKLGYNIMGPS